MKCARHFPALSALISISLSVATVVAEPMANPAHPQAADYLEPQILRDGADAEFLQRLALDEPSGNFYNFLILGQDNPAGPRRRIKTSRTSNGPQTEEALASRADIILLVSIDRSQKKGTIYSIYRGNTVPSYCFDRELTPGATEDMIITDFYVNYGRKAFLPCVRRMFSQKITASRTASEGLLQRDGQVQIHALFEGSKLRTVTPVAKGAAAVAMENKWFFTRTYGLRLASLFSVVFDANTIRQALNGEVSPSADIGAQADGKRLQRELMERSSHKAGGYQRSYNVARFIADLFGWAAPGIAANNGLMLLFDNVFSANISRSLSMKDFDRELREFAGGEHPMAWMGYRDGKSMVRIVQFGSSSSSFVVYDQGTSGRRAYGTLANLDTEMQLLPSPPDVP